MIRTRIILFTADVCTAEGLLWPSWIHNQNGFSNPCASLILESSSADNTNCFAQLCWRRGTDLTQNWVTSQGWGSFSRHRCSAKVGGRSVEDYSVENQEYRVPLHSKQNNRVVHIKCNNQSESQSLLLLERRDRNKKILSHGEGWVKLGYQTAQLLSITALTQWGNRRFCYTGKFLWLCFQRADAAGRAIAVVVHIWLEHRVPAASCCASCQWCPRDSWTPVPFKSSSGWTENLLK